MIWSNGLILIVSLQSNFPPVIFLLMDSAFYKFTSVHVNIYIYINTYQFTSVCIWIILNTVWKNLRAHLELESSVNSNCVNVLHHCPSVMLSRGYPGQQVDYNWESFRALKVDGKAFMCLRVFSPSVLVDLFNKICANSFVKKEHPHFTSSSLYFIPYLGFTMLSHTPI